MSEPLIQPIRELFMSASKRAHDMAERHAKDPTSAGVDSSVSYVDLFNEANGLSQEFLSIIERLSMAGSTVHAAHRLFCIKTEQLKKSMNALAGSQYDSQMENAALVEEAFADEIGFMRDFNKLIADRMLRDAGIDPTDVEAVKAHVQRNMPQ